MAEGEVEEVKESSQRKSRRDNNANGGDSLMRDEELIINTSE